MIHLGQIIQSEVESQRLTHKEFGALINKHEKTVPDIYVRASVSTELLVSISIALKRDFVSLLYNEGPMNDLRNDEVARLNLSIRDKVEEINLLKKELELMRDLNEAQKTTISFAKDNAVQMKILLKRYDLNIKSEE
ncbi:hypothetical protein [Longitalea luteola]|uniref:hypothetical protein n=1 Tax=Longitalea luteola TaxID=2812563 RepID=UPI001A95CEE6|nr:hypothetical protein [Longitalea luteola]